MKLSINNLNIGPYTKRHQSRNFSNKFTLHHEQYSNLYDNFSNLVDLTQTKILDFAGGFGNLIISSQGQIKPENYTCIDVDGHNIDKGKQKFPTASWIKSNDYNPMYNPVGESITEVDKKFDVIIAYSVFTHDSYESFISYLQLFKNWLLPNGKIFATVLLSNQPYINYLQDKRTRLYGDCDQIDVEQDINYLVNNRCFTAIPEKFECDFLLTIYKKSFIEKIGKIHTTELYQEAVIEVDTNKI